MTCHHEGDLPPTARRSFLYRAGTAILGAIVAVPAAVAGLRVLFDPARRKSKAPIVRIAPLTAVPADGLPHVYPVVTDRVDAWTRYPAQKVGSVYLIRQPGSSEVKAFTATCPHLGCFVDFAPKTKIFQCPCHTSKFEINGDRIGGDKSVAPRNMDSLNVEIRDEKSKSGDITKEVYVEFQRFLPGSHDKTPVA